MTTKNLHSTGAKHDLGCPTGPSGAELWSLLAAPSKGKQSPVVSGFLLLPLLPHSTPADLSSGLATPEWPTDTELWARWALGERTEGGAA